MGAPRLLLVDNYAFASGPEQFAFLDSNDNGRLDGGDDHVDARPVAMAGATKPSLVIDLGTVANEVEAIDLFSPGQFTLALHGVATLGEGDFYV